MRHQYADLLIGPRDAIEDNNFPIGFAQLVGKDLFDEFRWHEFPLGFVRCDLAAQGGSASHFGFQ